MPVVRTSKSILPADATLDNIQPSGNIEPSGMAPIAPLGDMKPIAPLGDIPDPNTDHMQTLYRDIPDANTPCPEIPNSESIVNTENPNNILSEAVNSDRHDPYRTPQIKDNPVEPKINKNTDGIGGDRKEVDVLKNEGMLMQTGLQKKLVGANPENKANEFPLKEEELDIHNNGSREKGSEQSTQNEEPYSGQGIDTKNGEKPMQDMKDTANQWSETNGSKGYNPFKPTRKKEIQNPKMGKTMMQYRQNLARIDTPFIPPNRATTREITQKANPNMFNGNNKSTTIRKGNTTVTF